ncbi:hypothetical protein M1K46_19305 [Fictibacillus sp. WQ 8-8]|uniref:hypothetical protein n=1 Tax=Fictibacillus sp. WQ 8-8 TaxID=2938788 RepID=UPI0021092809|nr:hypothetical protein [Fictibacillus sp. WQ 8-8]MCQ6267779.1 hypothetical protein [Fictibacillus sp. WQ 8-8]
MKTCPYCGSMVENREDHHECSFCEMVISFEDVQEDGKRKNVMPDHQPDIEDVHKTTPALMTYSTIELLYLLKIARSERFKTYESRRSILRALNHREDAYYRQGEKELYEQYNYWTRKCFVLENLVRDRQGYFPTKLSASYLEYLLFKIEKSSKTMFPY